MMFLVTVFVVCAGQAVVFGMGYGSMPFRGSYQGSCGEDGLYHSDATHFVICSKGVSTVQKCAPGTENSGMSGYHGFPTFCDVNLVDSGYNLAHINYAPPPHSAQPYPRPQTYPVQPTYAPDPKPQMYPEPAVYQSYTGHNGLSYRGTYQGSCNGDGLYYKDSTTYVVCSNNAATYQHCAPGTRNADNYQFNNNKDQAFCDVNLVDSGYNNARVYASVPHPSYPKRNPEPTYENPQPTYRPAPSSYKPAEPTYAPPQPAYKPHEPTYKPREPAYKPLEPTYKPREPVYKPQKPAYKPQEPAYTPTKPVSKPTHYNTDDKPQQMYQGRFQGKCGNDGLYYMNAEKFMFCSNGHAFEQNCAPGSRNSDFSGYNHGSSISSRDFCDINLVDSGYNLHQLFQRGYPAKRAHN